MKQKNPPSIAQNSDQTMTTPKRRRPNKKQQQKNPSQDESSQTSIEDLPQGILIHILTFLPITSAVKTTAIAPAWRNLWHFVPFLDFDMISFHSNIPNISIREARELFSTFINQTLIHRPSHSPLRKFKLLFCYRNNAHVQSYVDSWLKTVIGRKVEELDLKFQFHSYHHSPSTQLQEEGDDIDRHAFGFYSPQFPDFHDSSVRVLKLYGIEFRIPGEALSLKFDSIKEVHLEHFHSSDKDVEHLMASCVNLESLSLVSGGSFENLKIVSRQLKHLKLFDFNVLNFRQSSIDIRAPSLESIKLSYVYAEKFSLEKTPSLVKAEVIFIHRSWWDLAYWTNVLSYLTAVERLTIQHFWPWSMSCILDGPPATTREKLEEWIPRGKSFRIPHFLPEAYLLKLQPQKEIFESDMFQNLKHLELLTGFSPDDVIGLQPLFESSPELESMVLVSHYESSHDDDIEWLKSNRIVFYLPCLKFVEIKAFGETKNQMYVVDLLKYFGGELETIVAYPKEVNGISQPSVILYERHESDVMDQFDHMF